MKKEIEEKIRQSYANMVKPKEETPKELFTGGEWVNSPVMNFSDTLISYINSSTGKPVAQLRGCVNGEEKEAEANANLLAQAKNMYYALKGFVENAMDGKRIAPNQINYYKGLFMEILKKANPSL